MPRRARKESPSGIYHVVLRAVNQQQIFMNDADYSKFFFLLNDCSEKFPIKIYAYCLMSNHIHLLLHSSLPVLSNSLKSLSTRFVLWYNKKYERFGHLFQARFWSTPVTSNEQFLKTIFYIHENPVNANMCRFSSEYYWSSIGAYYGKSSSLVSIDMAVCIAGSLGNVQKYFSKCDSSEAEFRLHELPESPKRIIEEEALQRFFEITQCSSPSDFQLLPKVQRVSHINALINANLSISQIARFCGTSRKTIHTIIK